MTQGTCKNAPRSAAALCLLLGLLLVPAGVSADSPPFLAGAGDIAKCGGRLKNAEATAKLLDELFPPGEEANGVIFTLGDNVYPSGTREEFAECYEPTWGRHKERTRPTLGNHDYRTERGAPYFEYFGENAGDPGKGYYSYELGEWRILALNTLCDEDEIGCGPGSPQYEWLKQELEENPAACTAAYGHHPRFSSGKHGSEEAIAPLFELLYDYGVDVYLAGHEHNYERFGPVDPQGRLDPERGVRQFIVGAGGRELRSLSGFGGLLGGSDRLPASEAIDNTSYGILKLTLYPDSYEWEFLPIEGHSFRDSGSAECH